MRPPASLCGTLALLLRSCAARVLRWSIGQLALLLTTAMRRYTDVAVLRTAPKRIKDFRGLPSAAPHRPPSPLPMHPPPSSCVKYAECGALERPWRPSSADAFVFFFF
eukprot:RCo041783